MKTQKQKVPLFALGQILNTLGAIEALKQTGYDPNTMLFVLLARHVTGDWGKQIMDDDHDRQANEEAIKSGARIMSSYSISENVKIWVITEAEDDGGRRSATTLLLPDEY